MVAESTPTAAPATKGSVVATELPPTIEESAEITAVKIRQHYEELTAAGVVAQPPPQPVGLSPVPPPPPAPTGEGGRSVATETFSSVSVGSGGFGLAEGKLAVDLKMHAEVVLSGRAQPGQTLQLNGRWIRVNPDGTFSVRLALPLAKD